MEPLSLGEIAKFVNAENATDDATVIEHICTDTRKLSKGCLFIALKGERFDGHDYIRDAFSLGAAAVISQQKVAGGKALVVEDTRKAYLDLAAHYRERFGLHLVGVTGSVGKTTTKEMICCVLSSKYKTLKTKGNLNNDIGLPTTLLGLDKSYEAAVIEMGMSDFGEISVLSQTTKPTVAVITNIGYSHIEALGSREGILQAKLEILDGLDDSNPLILNADDELLFGVQNQTPREIIYYGIDNEVAHVRACNVQMGAQDIHFDIQYLGKKIPAVLPCTGRHNILNALAAFCVGLAADIDPKDIVKAYLSYKPADMRQNIISRGEQMLIVDCYNASPTSMEAAIDVLSDLPCSGRRIAVLGDMLELGTHGPQLHRDIADKVQDSKVDLLLCYGEQMAHCQARAQELGMQACLHFDTQEELSAYLRDTLRLGDLLLFKGSRGMQLEKVIDAVYGAHA